MERIVATGMQVAISFTYSDIFDEPAPELHVLLANMDSIQNISLLASINAQLYLDRNADEDILKSFLGGQPTSVASKIATKINQLRTSRPATHTSVFRILYTLEFIHYELSNFRTVKPTESAEGELAFFKAYLILSERLSNRLEPNLPDKNARRLPLQTRLWPIFIDQIVTEQYLDPMIEMVKSVAFLNFIQFASQHSSFVGQFLSKQNKATSWNYVLDIVGIISQVWAQSKEQPGRIPAFSISSNLEFNSFFENCSINLGDYQNRYRELKSSYTGLKERPLFRLDDKRLLILNWNFLAGKIYEGLIFDFHNLSGVQAKFNKFTSFKTFISHEFVEKNLFQNIIKGIFNGKKTTIRFDDGHQPGHPDAYVRKGKYIFLFEIKDAFFPTEVIDSCNYESIKSAVDKKFNAPGKGTEQLIKQIKHLSTKSYEDKSFDELNIKRRNVVIYPILVYTDRHFGMPGFNHYLATEFKDKLNQAQIPAAFESIRPLTFMNLSFLLSCIDLLQAENPSLQQALDAYHDFLRSSEKQFRKKVSIKLSLDINENFENLIGRKFRSKIENEHRNFVEVVNRELKLTDHLSP